MSTLMLAMAGGGFRGARILAALRCWGAWLGTHWDVWMTDVFVWPSREIGDFQWPSLRWPGSLTVAVLYGWPGSLMVAALCGLLDLLRGDTGPAP